MRVIQSKMWQTLEDFEKQLPKQIRGDQVEAQRQIEEQKLKTKQIQRSAFFYIEALENALNSTKIKYQNELDRVNMELNDMQSYFMNLDVRGRYETVENFEKEEKKKFRIEGIDVEKMDEATRRRMVEASLSKDTSA